MSPDQPPTVRRPSDPTAETLPDPLALAFAPLHKRTFGIAVGAAAGLVVFLLTAYHLLVQPPLYQRMILVTPDWEAIITKG